MKIALVTGESRGLGRTLALHLAKQGRDVILTYRSAKSEADDIGGAVAALVSDDTDWINGRRVEVSGGMFL